MDAIDTEIEAGSAPTLKEIAGKRTDLAHRGGSVI